MEKKLPIVAEKDLTKAGENFLNLDQLKLLLGRTPTHFIKERPAKGGGTWKYVTGSVAKKTLNYLFGWNWNFEILEHTVYIDAAEVVVKGRLTCRSKDMVIVKEQFGNHDIQFKNEYVKDENGKQVMESKGGRMKPKVIKTQIPLSIGNDLKSAATDALKKCCNELGMFSDVYAEEEFKDIEIEAEENPYNLEQNDKNKEGKRIEDHILSSDDLATLSMVEPHIKGNALLETLYEGRKKKILAKVKINPNG
jgi:hypothetical protein